MGSCCRAVRRVSEWRCLHNCADGDPGRPISAADMRAVRLCAAAAPHHGAHAIQVGHHSDVMRAVRLCALERLTMARRSSKGCRVERYGRRGIRCARPRASFARERGVRDDERISGKPLPVPGSRVIPSMDANDFACSDVSERLVLVSTTQECESSREFAKIFRVSRYGSQSLPFTTYPGMAHFCLSRDEQRRPQPGVKRVEVSIFGSEPR